MSTPPNPAAAGPAPELIGGRYQVMDTLGEGTSGRVVKAFDKHLRRPSSQNPFAEIIEERDGGDGLLFRMTVPLVRDRDLKQNFYRRHVGRRG